MFCIMAAKCFICEGDLNDSGVGVSRVGEKGLASLLTASIATNDNWCSQLRGLTSIKVHTFCRKKYTRTNSIVADVKRKSQTNTSLQPEDDDNQSVTLRSSTPTFDFKTMCFFFVLKSLMNNSRKERGKKPKDKAVCISK